MNKPYEKMILANDFKAQWSFIKNNFMEAVNRVGESGYLILGPEVKEFEKKLALFCGSKFVVGCANGLDAIEIALRCLGLKNGQKVLTTPLSAFATTLAVLRAGGIPVFVDVDETGLMDLNLAEKALNEDSEIKFLLPVHLFGQALPLKKLNELKVKYNISIIEDCAQALGAKSDGSYVGSVGQASATSFYPTKNLGCYGDGGALFTNSEQVSTQAACLRDYGQKEKYSHSFLGLNSRLDELQAAVLNSSILPNLVSWNKRRGEIAQFYKKNINNKNIKIMPIPDKSESIWHLFPILIEKNRELFMNKMKSLNINVGIHYPITIPDQSLFASEFKGKLILNSKIDVARHIANTEVSLPIHPFLTQNEIDFVVAACNSWEC